MVRADSIVDGVKTVRGTRKTIHIQKAHEGLLHRELDVPMGQPIPAAKLEKALHSSDPAERKRAQFAENVRHFRHAKKGR